MTLDSSASRELSTQIQVTASRASPGSKGGGGGTNLKLAPLRGRIFRRRNTKTSKPHSKVVTFDLRDLLEGPIGRRQLHVVAWDIGHWREPGRLAQTENPTPCGLVQQLNRAAKPVESRKLLQSLHVVRLPTLLPFDVCRGLR